MSERCPACEGSDYPGVTHVLGCSHAPASEMTIPELVAAIHSELQPVYHVTPGGLKWSKSTDALRELANMAMSDQAVAALLRIGALHAIEVAQRHKPIAWWRERFGEDWVSASGAARRNLDEAIREAVAMAERDGNRKWPE